MKTNYIDRRSLPYINPKSLDGYFICFGDLYEAGPPHKRITVDNINQKNKQTHIFTFVESKIFDTSITNESCDSACRGRSSNEARAWRVNNARYPYRVQETRRPC